jgi:hypothetical protein
MGEIDGHAFPNGTAMILFALMELEGLRCRRIHICDIYYVQVNRAGHPARLEKVARHATLFSAQC